MAHGAQERQCNSDEGAEAVLVFVDRGGIGEIRNGLRREDEIRISELAVCRRWDYWVRRILGGRECGGAKIRGRAEGERLSETLIWGMRWI